jgi:hypothetical protein
MDLPLIRHHKVQDEPTGVWCVGVVEFIVHVATAPGVIRSSPFLVERGFTISHNDPLAFRQLSNACSVSPFGPAIWSML